MNRGRLCTRSFALLVAALWAGGMLGPGNAAVADTPDLLPVPFPDLGVFEKGVRESLAKAQAAVSAQTAADDPLQRAIEYGRLGMLYQAYDMPEQAEPCYLNALQLDPQHYQWPYLLAYQYQLNGRLDKAAEFYRRTLAIEPDNLPALLHLGQALNKLDLSDQAEQVFNKALALSPGQGAALEGLSEIAYRRQDYATTIRLLEQALAREPGADRLNYQLGMAYRRQGDLDKARLHLEQRGKGSPSIPDPVVAALNALLQTSQVFIKDGLAAYEAGDYVQAASDYARALDSDPADRQTRLALAWALELSGDDAGASRELEIVLAQSPGEPKAHYLKGALLAEANALEPAAEHLRIAVDAEPEAVSPRLILATVLMNLGAYPEAAEHYAVLATRQTDDEVLLYRLGMARLAAGGCADAIAPLEEALRRRAGSLTLMQSLLRAYALCPDAEGADADTALVQSQRLFNGSRRWDTAETLAMALAANRRYAEAQALQDEVIRQARLTQQTELVIDGLLHNLRRYSEQRLADQAWPPGDAVFKPPMITREERRRLDR